MSSGKAFKAALWLKHIMGVICYKSKPSKSSSQQLGYIEVIALISKVDALLTTPIKRALNK